jgi:hypothetical protein
VSGGEQILLGTRLGAHLAQSQRLQTIGVYTVIRSVLVVAIFLALSCGHPEDFRTRRHPVSHRDAAIDATICGLVADPRAFDGKKVRVSGCITTDGYEYIVLSDPSNACGGLVPDTQLDPAAGRVYLIRPDRRVCGVFTGTFQASNPVYGRFLQVESSKSVVSKFRPPADRKVSASGAAHR